MVVNNTPFNPVEILLEEVSLEGLDGITLEALWTRLQARLEFKEEVNPLDHHWKQFYFELLKKHHADISAFELPEERGKLVIFDFKEHIDKCTFAYVEPEQRPPDIYPFATINDEELGIMGSCSTYHKRKNITQTIRSMSYNQACETYQNKLVFVASQQLRRKYLVLTKRLFIPTSFEISLQSYCILERIGRCRANGCIDISKECIKVAPKDIFYRRKELLQFKLITKQSLCKHKKKGIMRMNLYYLPRFHVEQKSKVNSFMEKILSALKASSSKNYTLPTKSFNEIFGYVSALSVKRLVQYFHLDDKVREVELPFSKVYPDLPRNQWYNAKKEEKLAVCYQLLDPNMNIEKELNKDFDIEDPGSDEEEDIEDWEEEENEQDLMETQSQQSWASLLETFTVDPVSDLSDGETVVSIQDKVQVDSSSSDEEFVEQSMDISFLKKKGFKIEDKNAYDLSLRKQMMLVVEQAGPQGCSALHIQKKLSLLRGDIRTLVRHNVKYLHTYMKDEGRQRTSYIRLKQFANCDYEIKDSDLDNQCETPCKKIKLENEEETYTGTLNVEPANDNSELQVTPSSQLGTKEQLQAIINEEIHPKKNILTNLFPTELQRKRAYDMIQFINESRVALIRSQLYSFAIEKDKERHVNEENQTQIDRKTIQRMLDKLVNHGFIKRVHVTFQGHNQDKIIQWYAKCDFDIESEEFKKLVQLEKPVFSSDAKYSSLARTPKHFKFETLTNLGNKLSTQSQCQKNQSGGHKSENKNTTKDSGESSELSRTKADIKILGNSSVRAEISVLLPVKELTNDLSSLYPTTLMSSRVTECYEYIQQNRIIAGWKDVLNYVVKCDEKRNYKARVDHRTIKRLLEKLSTHNIIKCFFVKFTNLRTHAEKEMSIYSLLEITSEDTEFVTVLEREYLLFWGESGSQASKMKLLTSNEYLSLPKFAKMEKMHLLSFYTAYCTTKPREDQDLARKNLELNANIKMPDDHPTIYNDTELNDFTFLPTLSPVYSFPQGFINFHDFFSLIPIRTLLECLRTNIFVKELDYYYNDPVRRFYPVKDTSPDIFTLLTRQQDGRKNVANVFQIFSNLATIGLVQFGKRNGPEKENFVLYINKKASLRDTINVNPSYIKLNPTQLRPPVQYELTELATVKQYWLNSCHICTSTPLGIRQTAIGQKVTSYKKMQDNPNVSLFCEHCDDMNLILQRDNGITPGDNLGAAGYDSTSFAHMKKNWSSTAKVIKTMPVVKPARGINKPSKLFRNKMPKREEDKKPNYSERIVKARKSAKIRKPKIVNKSSMSLSEMRRMRTQIKWTDTDSDILHLTAILYKVFKVKPCNRLTRDILVKLLDRKANKAITSKMLLSHYRRILKIPENQERYTLLQAEVNHRREVRNFLIPYLKEHWDLCRKKQKTEAHRYIIENFRQIVKTVYETTVLNQNQLNKNSLPSNYKQFLTEYRIVDSKETLQDLYPPLNSSNNIKLHVLVNLVHSSLATFDPMDNDKMQHCMFDAYERYNETLVHKATRILKNYQIITTTKCLSHQLTLVNKPVNKPNAKPTPLPITRFKLNIKYIFKLSFTEMQYSSFNGSYRLLKQVLRSGESAHHIVNVDSAYLNLLTAILGEDGVTIDIEMPTTLLTLDPKIVKLNSEFEKIVERYYQLVDHYKVGTIDKLKHVNEEDKDDFELENIPPMNLFNAARLAMYTLKDVLVKEKISAQHVQRLMMLNTCKLSLSGVKKQDRKYMSKNNAYIRKLNDQLCVPALTQDEINKVVSHGLETQLAEFIENKLELGAPMEDLRDQFGMTKKVKAGLDSLVEKHIVIRTGNVSPVYVHNKHCSAWLVKHSPSPDTKTVESQIAPWVYVNATLNRPVLDYFLGVLLSYIIFNPGVTLLTLQEHFSSVLQPMNSTNLVEILAHIKCIIMQAMTVVKPTLFNKGSVKVFPATGMEPADMIYLEAGHDAALKLGIFIGDPAYEKSYLEFLTKVSV
uniref:General transcription factor 3C polypeptide 1 n=1 Tax=Cacopsylla melanoneura TaxID=428564 RepID=A0A8D8SPL0_9HEMI